MNQQLKSPHPVYHAINDEYDEYEEEEWHISDRTKRWLVFSGMLSSLVILYFFCFALPMMFIPPTQALHPIAMVKDLPVLLRPLSEDTKTWEALSNGKKATNGQDEEEEDENGNDQNETDGNETDGNEINGGDRMTKERLVLVGDIHGQYKEFRKLMRKVQFDPEKDHLVVLGDFMSKGPKSLEVIDELIALNASCVLGNHESYALANYAHFHNLKPAGYSNNQGSDNNDEGGDNGDNGVNGGDSVSDSNSDGKNDIQSDTNIFATGFNLDPEYILAKKLEPRHIKYINSCSVMMKLGRVPLHSKQNNGNKGYAAGVAVHAGLRWDVSDLEAQDPQDCLEMRSYIGPYYNETTDNPKQKHAVSWSKIYNQKQKAHEAAQQHVVYYGHDARRGLNLKKWAKGLDTGCLRGDMLTAVVVWRERTKRGEDLYKEVPVSVRC